MSNTYILNNVYNTLTGGYEDVEVNEAVYNCYRRSAWNIDKNDAKHSANSIPFSALIGGDDGAYENFHEFISDADVTPNAAMDSIYRESLYQAMDSLAENESDLITALFFDRKSEREYAEETGILPMTIHDRKVKILGKLKFLMDFEK